MMTRKPGAMTKKPQRTEKPQEKQPAPSLLGAWVDVNALAAATADERLPVSVPSVRFAGGAARSEQDQAGRVRLDLRDRLGMTDADDGEAA